MEIRFFGTYIDDFLILQPKEVRKDVLWALGRLRTYGHELRMPDSRYLGKGLYELRAIGISSARLFYVFKDDEAFIVHAFTKKSDKIPLRELRTARARQRALASI